MDFKASLKRRIQESGWYVRKAAGLPVGVDLFEDLRRFGIRPKCLLDIGAHHGHTAIKYVERFPGCRIFAFEPVSANFNRLKNAVSHLPAITPVRSAVGDKRGKADIGLHPVNSEAHSLVRKPGTETECIEVTTIDDFCADRGIQPDFIKIDTEGFELEVLAGADLTLGSSPALKAILVEATLSATNKRHIQLSELSEAMPGFGLAAIYDQCQWHTTGKLEFFNALFVRPAAANEAERQLPAASKNPDR